MNTKNVIIFCLLIVLFFTFGKHFLQEKNDIIDHKKITIFVLDPLLGVHAKMITGERGDVTILTENGLTNDIIKKMGKDDVVIGLEGLTRENFFQRFSHYLGHYIVIPEYSKYVVLFDEKSIQNQIEVLRDALSDISPDNKNYFYDKAGNYFFLIETSRKNLQSRLQRYNISPFITIGYSFGGLIETFKLSEYHIRHVDDIESFPMNQKNIKLNTENTQNTVKYYFYRGGKYFHNPKSTVLKNEIYVMPTLSTDTSEYGYIKLMEKTINEFIAAFDTYD